MYKVDLGNGFHAVPADTVCLNGMYLERLNTTTECDDMICLLMPTGKAAMDETGTRPYVYRSLDECRKDKDIIAECEPSAAVYPAFWLCGMLGGYLMTAERQQQYPAITAIGKKFNDFQCSPYRGEENQLLKLAAGDINQLLSEIVQLLTKDK